MTKQPEDWLDDVPGDDIEDEDDEIIWVSKSEIKRDAEELKRLGAEIVDLGKNALDKIPLDADLRAAIELAQRIKMEGRRRQLQLIGKMLRQRDVEPIRQALDKLKNRHNQQVVLFHKLENLLVVTKIVTVHYFEFGTDFDSGGESHDFWEMVYVGRGEVECRAGETDLILHAGEAIFHAPDEYHRLIARAEKRPQVMVFSFECRKQARVQIYGSV